MVISNFFYSQKYKPFIRTNEDYAKNLEKNLSDKNGNYYWAKKFTFGEGK